MRISTTMLESFRRVLFTEYGSEAELIAQVRGEPFPKRWQMDAGTAWHNCLEGQRCELKHVDDVEGEQGEWEPLFQWESGGYLFSQPAVDLSRQHVGPGIHEVKVSAVICGATIVAQADHVRGLMIQDNKTKFSTCDARDYEQSLQWRLYLLIHEAKVFRYNLFDFLDPKEGYCQLKDIISFRFWPYVGMKSDCEHWVSEFIAWAKSRNLTQYLERQSSTPEAA